MRRHFVRSIAMAVRCAALVLALCLLGPSGGAWAADPIFPPASRVGIAPPPGFVLGQNFPGFRHNEKAASILIAELPGAAFETIEKQITADMGKDPSMALTRSEVKLKEGSGFILQGKLTGPQGPVLRWTLVSQVGAVTAMVTAIIPEQVQDVVSDEAIRASFTSLTVRQSVPLEEQLSVLPFSMRELGGFRIVRVEPGAAAILTDGPKDMIDVTEQPLFLLAIAPSQAQPQPAERDSVARRLFGEFGGLKDIRVLRSEPLRVAGQQGHELMVEAKDAKSDTDVTAVQWLRFGTGTLFRMVAIARKDKWTALYPRFRKVRDGIGPK